jgi:hypothetical protein
MPLSPQQQQAQAAKASANVAAAKESPVPADDTYQGEAALDSDWLALLSKVAQHQLSIATGQSNQGTYSTKPTTRSARVLSADGFPPNVKVLYTPAVPGSYTAWTKDTAREVKQIVLQSFGQPWHAFKSSGKWKGAMNRTGGRYFYLNHITDTLTILAWLPSGTVPEQGMSNAKRLSFSLQNLLNPQDGNTGAHFIIDRQGNLFITGDANNIYNSSGSLSATCISIALEEAMYLDVNLGDTSAYEATWIPGGESTLKFWDYSPMQYTTLAALVAKLQYAYPALLGQTYSTSKDVTRSFTGITMRGHITGTASSMVDVSPHFSAPELWDTFFEKVSDQSTSVLNYNVWKSNDESYASHLSWVREAVSTVGKAEMGVGQMLTNNPALAVMSGLDRADAMASMTLDSYRANAARKAVGDSNLQLNRQNVGRALAQEADRPFKVPGSNASSDNSERLF